LATSSLFWWVFSTFFYNAQSFFWSLNLFHRKCHLGEKKVVLKRKANKHCWWSNTPYRVQTATCYTTFQKHQPLLLLPMHTNICVWCCSFLKTINSGLTFVGTKNSDQQMRENDNSRNDLCRFYFHSLNRILSGTIEIERRIRENELSGNDG
jgi:hypothetical protein